MSYIGGKIVNSSLRFGGSPDYMTWKNIEIIDPIFFNFILGNNKEIQFDNITLM